MEGDGARCSRGLYVPLRQIVKEKVRGKGLEEEQSDENGKIEVVV